MRLRELGTTFHEEVPPPTENTEKVKHQRLANYLRLLFGYPLAQVLGQHYGLTSEGLDVTSDPDIAAFFASFDFHTGRFVESDQETGVIYRFAVKSEVHSLGAFKSYNIYTCPTYLQPDVLRLFGTCDDFEESFDSFLTYIARMNETAGVGNFPDRALELIRFPAAAIKSSRVSRQRAGLLFPDLILSESYRMFALAPPPRKAEKVGLNAVEDLSTRAGTSMYRFRHSEQSKRFIRSYQARLFEDEDGLQDAECIS